MKILNYSVIFSTESTGVGNYSCEMAAWLVAQGYEAQAVITPPYYFTWQLE